MARVAVFRKRGGRFARRSARGQPGVGVGSPPRALIEIVALATASAIPRCYSAATRPLTRLIGRASGSRWMTRLALSRLLPSIAGMECSIKIEHKADWSRFNALGSSARLLCLRRRLLSPQALGDHLLEVGARAAIGVYNRLTGGAEVSTLHAQKSKIAAPCSSGIRKTSLVGGATRTGSDLLVYN